MDDYWDLHCQDNYSLEIIDKAVKDLLHQILIYEKPDLECLTRQIDA